MSVHWNKGMNVYVQLAPSWAERVCGLCGYFDFLSSNDLMTSNGAVLSSSPQLFGTETNPKRD